MYKDDNKGLEDAILEKLIEMLPPIQSKAIDRATSDRILTDIARKGNEHNRRIVRERAMIPSLTVCQGDTLETGVRENLAQIFEEEARKRSKRRTLASFEISIPVPVPALPDIGQPAQSRHVKCLVVLRRTKRRVSVKVIFAFMSHGSHAHYALSRTPSVFANGVALDVIMNWAMSLARIKVPVGHKDIYSRDAYPTAWFRSDRANLELVKMRAEEIRSQGTWPWTFDLIGPELASWIELQHLEVFDNDILHPSTWLHRVLSALRRREYTLMTPEQRQERLGKQVITRAGWSDLYRLDVIRRAQLGRQRWWDGLTPAQRAEYNKKASEAAKHRYRHLGGLRYLNAHSTPTSPSKTVSEMMMGLWSSAEWRSELAARLQKGKAGRNAEKDFSRSASPICMIVEKSSVDFRFSLRKVDVAVKHSSLWPRLIDVLVGRLRPDSLPGQLVSKWEWDSVRGYANGINIRNALEPFWCDVRRKLFHSNQMR